MTNATTNDGQPPDSSKSGRYSFKSEGRRQHMLRLLAERKVTGQTLKHGIRGLEDRIRRGLDPDTPLAVLHAERRAAYIQDLGGEATVSAMEAGIADRLADLDLVRGLLNTQRAGAKKMSLKALHDHVQAVTRNVVAYVQAAKAIGPGRREKPTDKTVLVRRYAVEPSGGPSNGQDEANADIMKQAGEQEAGQ